ncbi:MAG: sigma-54-dependent Fis family transcriptional regulator [Burkholderiales bacterium]|nr:sigma-54-dependent Fis family transcriptional regulator [Burkholderiales bacterium]
MDAGNGDSGGRIAAARKFFFDRGSLPPGSIPEAVERSWRRCLDAGLDAGARPVFEPVESARLRQLREQSHLLTARAQPVMETLYEQIAHTESMVILTDAKGMILHSLGDDDFVARAHQVALQPGVMWDEDHNGTNAIGTALVEAKAVSVNGSEHFFPANHFLACSASPILDPFGNVIGALDVSSDHRGHQPHTLALVRMSAQMIENHLFREQFPGLLLVHFHARPEFIGTLCEGIVAFTPDGRFVSGNRSGVFQLGSTLLELSKHTFDSLFDIPMHMALPRARQDGLMTLTMHTGVRVFAKVQMHGPAKGKVVPLEDFKRAPARVDANRRANGPSLDYLNSGDPRIAVAVTKVRRVLGRDIPVLIQGETGTGKEWFAKALHEDGPRRHNPFVAVNCAAIPEGLIESELFGYEEGAFTGARRKGAPGKILQADGGTLFLDEIGDMPLSLQARLLRVLQERTITPLGSTRAYPVDVGLVCATHRKLRELIARGQFREDLYYRLNGLVVTLPPLRERTDLPALVRRLLEGEARRGEHIEISTEVMELFRHHSWPGNLRQLHNLLRTALAMVDDDGLITRHHLPDDFLEEFGDAGSPLALPPQAIQAEMRGAEPIATGSLDDLEASAIQRAVEFHRGNISAAARELGISRNTLYRKLQR